MNGRRSSELGDFLRSRRAALTPSQAGVSTYGDQRRVPGLRRAEVAQLAGMSVNYYTRIEQGESHQISESVREALANALRMDPTERAHLQRLAGSAPVSEYETEGPEVVRDSLRALIEGNTEQCMMLLGRRTDVLAANRLGYALLGLPVHQRPNLARLIFLEPAMRDLFTDWKSEAQRVAAALRMASSYQPEDPLLAELVGELSIKSADFSRLWAEHPVAACLHSVNDYEHPLVGRLTLRSEGLLVPDEPGWILVSAGAVPGSDSADRLRILASLVA